MAVAVPLGSIGTGGFLMSSKQVAHVQTPMPATEQAGPGVGEAPLSNDQLASEFRSGRGPATIARADPPPGGPVEVPTEGQTVNQLGIVAHDGSPALQVRSEPSTSADNVVGTFPFNTTLQVMKRMDGGWLFVSSPTGLIGYVAAQYVWTEPEHVLPEPNAKLHRVDNNQAAIGIAEQYYRQHADDWGQDLRFYVNVLAEVNGIRAGDDWENVHFRAGQFIWVPSVEFARGMQGSVSSGSISYEAADSIGVAGAIERVGQLVDDFQLAIQLSGQHIPGAIARHVERSLIAVLESLMLLAVGAVALVAVTTAVGAAIGALGGGVGAAPGAAAGFEVGIALLHWLGLGFLVVWLADAVGRVGGAFAAFFGAVWNANGDRAQVEGAAVAFAEAIGTLCGVLIEALVMWAASVGVSAAVGALRGTQVGRAFGETRLNHWLTERLGNVRSGEAALNTPSRPGVRCGARVSSVRPKEARSGSSPRSRTTSRPCCSPKRCRHDSRSSWGGSALRTESESTPPRSRRARSHPWIWRS